VGGQLPAYPEGVTVRKGKKRETIYISFQYKGVQCKEPLKNLVPNKQNIKYATNIKAEIEAKITRDIFRYTDYFPNSLRARKFGHAVSNANIKELLTAWLKDIERSHPHSTYKCYRKDINSTLIPCLGDFRASDLATNPEPIREMIRQQNNTLKTIRNKLTPLRAIFDQAVADGMIERNPMDKIKVSKLADSRKVSGNKTDPFSLDEIAAILAAAKKHKPEWLNYFQFVFYSGVRTSEGFSITWADIDWINYQVRINKAMVMREEKEVKTEASERDIDLLPMAEQALIRQKEVTFIQGGNVFLNPSTNKPIIDYEETNDIFTWLQKKAGVRRRTQRQTRHSFASNLLSGGENIYYVAEQLGHANIEMVMKVYGKWVEDGQQKRKREWISDFGNMGRISSSLQHKK